LVDGRRFSGDGLVFIILGVEELLIVIIVTVIVVTIITVTIIVTSRALLPFIGLHEA
jgi:hypothetical protein